MKLWKHHAAQPEADRINAVAAERGEPWLARYGGQDLVGVVLRQGAADPATRRPRSTHRADRLIEAADWVVWQLTGVETQEQLHGRLQGDVVEARRVPLARRTSRRSTRASSTSSTRRCRATIAAARRTGRRAERARRPHGPGCARAPRSRSPTSTPRARCRRPTVTEPGTMVMIMGTSTCHICCSATSSAMVEGMCGVVEDGIVPGLLRVRGGPVGGRRHLRVVRASTRCRPSTTRRPERGRERARRASRRRRPRFGPGESGLLALDWWNGNRSVLVDADLQRPARRA